MTKRTIVIAAVAVFVLTLFGCATTGSDARTGDAEAESVLFGEAALTNRISVDGFRYAIPTDWEYGPSIGDGVLFTFRRGDDLTGSVEMVRFPEPVSVERFLTYFKEHVFVSDERVGETTLESVQRGTIHVFTGTVDERAVASAIVVAPEEALLVHIATNADIAPTNTDLLMLVEGVERSPREVEYRLSPGRVGFVDTEGVWRWISDDGDGFVAINTGDDDILAGIRRVSEAERRRIADDWGEELVEARTVAPSLRGAETLPWVYQRHDSRMEDVAVVYRRGDEYYLLRLAQRHLTGEFDLTGLLSRPDIQAFLDFSAVFPDQGVEL